MKIGFLFPGQGSQTVGMGKDIYDEYNTAKNVYDRVQKLTGIDIAKISFEGPADVLNETKYTQLAILTMSLAILEILKANNINSEISAGLSLGEYSALINSNALSFDEGVKLVQKRGEYMQNLTPKGDFKMAAIMGMTDDKVEEVCKKVKSGFVVPANYNSPGQVVISGEEKAVLEAESIAKNMGAKKVRILNTAGPFHTEKLVDCANKLKNELKKVKINNFESKVIKNLDGTEYKQNDDVRDILVKHIINPVRFSKSIQTMLDAGIDTFIEIGPGKTLSGFVKRTNLDRQINILNISNSKELKNVINFVKNGGM